MVIVVVDSVVDLNGHREKAKELNKRHFRVMSGARA
jgi:hypothetical protein